MSFRNRIRSFILNRFFSPTVTGIRRRWAERRRKFGGRAHVVSVFLQIDDPYSYVLSHYLPALGAHYNIELQLYLSQSVAGAYQPAPDLQVEYAIADCKRLAAELGIPFLDKGQLPPTEYRAGLSDAVAEFVSKEEFSEQLFQALSVFWRGDTAAAAEISRSVRSAGTANSIVADSKKRQRRLGHYSSAMLHYGGEWFWGVDRLHCLMDRLDALGAARSAAADLRLASIKQAMTASLPVRPPAAATELPPIEFFFSFRSPYSYLAMGRVFEIADAYGLVVKLRPVLPMMMRGMQVPRRKLLYIVNDTIREAQRRGLPFGKIADPIGRGVERCLAVNLYAESEKRAREFILNAGYAIWAAGIDVATDKGMRKVTAQCGLFWPDVEKAMNRDDWRERVDKNRESMMKSGSWGVPTVRMGELVLWGHDRDWMLVRHIEELCDTGDGILV